MAYNAAMANLRKAESELKLLKAGSWAYDIAVGKAAVVQSQAQIQQLQMRIDRTKVKAPDDGNVLQVNIREGEYAGAQRDQTLVMIGQTDVLHVRVDIDEMDIPRFQIDAEAYAMLKGGQTDKIKLKYQYREPYVIPKQSLTGLNTERVDTRVMQVVYSVEPTNLPLLVGQQVDVFMNAAIQKKPASESATTAKKTEL
jgi:HlyD family secretion protein